jgi:uncharacterized membrane protein YfcA
MESVWWGSPLRSFCSRHVREVSSASVTRSWPSPLLMMVVDPTTAVATVALLSLAQGLLMLARERRDIDWGASRRLVIAAAVGVPSACSRSRSCPPSGSSEGSGSCSSPTRRAHCSARSLPELRSGRAAAVAGFASGALGAAYNFSGPPVILYSSMARWDAAKTRATLQSFFTPLGVLVVAAHFIAGSITSDVLTLSARCLPAMLVGVIAGAMLSARIDASLFRKVFDAVLVAVGVMLWI